MTPCATRLFEEISQRGHRLTRTRRAVIEALCKANRPVCVKTLHAAAGEVDLVTVYRAVHWLVGLELAREVVTATGGERYELVNGEHSHHLNCEQCGEWITVPVCGIPQSVFAAVLRDHDFAVNGHRLTFVGLCAVCRKAPPDGKARARTRPRRRPTDPGSLTA